MKPFRAQHPSSILFITLDSCRYDTFQAAHAPNFKAVGELHRAMAPGNFTYSSHAAMFVGFTPGVAETPLAFINPKFGKIFKMVVGGHPGKGTEFLSLEGANIIDGLKRQGYHAIGTAALGWFDPGTETGCHLSKDFDDFFYAGDTASLGRQLDWVGDRLEAVTQPVFLFLNIGETHVPYYFKGAPWSWADNPCIPFATDNDAGKCRVRQAACLEFIDREIAPLLDAFGGGTTVICADHGDCWGEDGLWEHGIHHEKVLEVPLIFRLGARPQPLAGMGA